MLIGWQRAPLCTDRRAMTLNIYDLDNDDHDIYDHDNYDHENDDHAMRMTNDERVDVGDLFERSWVELDEEVKRVIASAGLQQP